MRAGNTDTGRIELSSPAEQEFRLRIFDLEARVVVLEQELVRALRKLAETLHDGA